MEMHKYVKQDASVEMDMTPMIDIVFLLIIFFMVVTELSNLDIEEVVLPVAPLAEAQEAKAGVTEIKINVVISDPTTGKGEIKISGDLYTREELVKKLIFETQVLNIWEPNPKDATRKESALEILVRADQGVNSEYIHWIYDACKKAKVYKVRLAALSERLENAYEE